VTVEPAPTLEASLEGWRDLNATLTEVIEQRSAPFEIAAAAVSRSVELLAVEMDRISEQMRRAEQAVQRAFAPVVEHLAGLQRLVSEWVQTEGDGLERQLRRARFEIALDRRRRVRAHLLRLRSHLRRLPSTVPVELVEALAAVVAAGEVLLRVRRVRHGYCSTFTTVTPKHRPLTWNLCPHAPPVASRSVHETTTARYSTTRPPGD
jgi:hypothetical protein